MNIELKKIKYAAFASEETSCFTAEIWIDGKKEGTVSNDGHGGSDNLHPWQLGKRIDEYAKTLPQRDVSDIYDDGKKHFMEESAETLIGDLLNDFLAAKELKRLLSKKVVYKTVGEKSFYSTRSLDADRLAKCIANPLKMLAPVGVEKIILNTMPINEAIALYRA